MPALPGGAGWALVTGANPGLGPPAGGIHCLWGMGIGVPRGTLSITVGIGGIGGIGGGPLTLPPAPRGGNGGAAPRPIPNPRDVPSGIRGC